jgi:hypothetical protein
MAERDRGELLTVGTCMDCSEPIMMFESEKEFYDNLVKTKKGFKFPKRCAKCREIKKQNRERGVQVRDLAKDVRAMVEKAINSEYDSHGDTLAQELSDLAAKLEQYDQPREHTPKGEHK